MNQRQNRKQDAPLHFVSRQSRPTDDSSHIKNAAIEFMAPIKTKTCIFCGQKEHSKFFCNTLSVEDKKKLLMKEGRCFLCLKKSHKIKSCRSQITCTFCKQKHNPEICYKSKLTPSELAEKDRTESKVVSAISHTENNGILLQTCCVKIENGKRQSYVRFLLDSASMKSFITKDVADKLRLTVVKKEKLSVFAFGGKSPIEKNFDVVKITLKSRYSPETKIEIEELVNDQISGCDIPPPRLNHYGKNKFHGLTLADSPDCQEPISILIGADYYYNVVTGNIKHLNKDMVAVETIFGWWKGRNSNYASLSLSVVVEENAISEQLRKFWDIETSGLIEKRDPDNSEHEIIKTFESNIRYRKYRYEIRLPWRADMQLLNNNREVAELRFERLKKRFQRNPELFLSYKAVLQDYLNQGIIESVPVDSNEENCVTFYLPHREVIRQDHSTKLRIVFDASSHVPNFPSLNDCLYSGPNLNADMFDILLKFRFNAIAFTADIKQAFLLIVIKEQDRDVTRFLFTEDPTDDSLPPIIYRFTRVLFGFNSSPFLLAATIKYHLKKYLNKYPKTVKFLNENIYVDDMIGSVPSVEEALDATLESIHIFEEASMHLHKWRTNSSTLRRLWEEKGITSVENSEIFGGENLPYKVLGIAWNSFDDVLYFDVESLLSFLSKKVFTKRFILQAISRVYDPLGILSPFTIRAKCLMQKIWCLGIDWDETLPEDICASWKSWCDEVPQLAELSIPRYYFAGFPNEIFENLELHSFSDASQNAYGTVIYLRGTTSGGLIQTVFVASKSRVAPLKTLTLPRLELMGALLSAKLCSNVLNAFKLKLNCYFWTDSKITYYWIRKSPEKFKPFVKNRVEEIQKLTSPTNWHHCPGSENPADLVSRGTKVDNLMNDSLWLRGPAWLQQPPEFWPKLDDVGVINEDQLEYRQKFRNIIQCECIIEESEDSINISKYSNLEKLLRITAWVKRFISKLKKSSVNQGTLTVEELREAEKYWIRTEQMKFFKKEINSLKETSSVDKNSTLYNFAPYLDENGILRIKGRLEFSSIPTTEQQPAILPKNSWFTTLIVQQEHERTMHGGVAVTLTKVRSKFWIPKGRQLIKSVIHRCLICQKYSAKPANQMTAPLPEDRS